MRAAQGAAPTAIARNPTFLMSSATASLLLPDSSGYSLNANVGALSTQLRLYLNRSVRDFVLLF